MIENSEKAYKRSYNTLHVWLSRNYVKQGICENCKDIGKTEWSNKTGDLIRDRSNWQELCKKCHAKYDKEILEIIGGRGNQKQLYKYFAYGEYFN